MTNQSRVVAFTGVTNFRDIGGYPTADGHHTRWGSVYRADALHRLTEEDLSLYESLGIRTVYDLRSDRERESYPDPFPNVHLPLLAPDGARKAAEEYTSGEHLLRATYRAILLEAAPLFGQLLTGLSDPSALPAVFHCAGGKDRTGLSAALLLHVLGVSRPAILDDYELTSQYRRREHQQASYESLLSLGLPPEAAASVLGTPRPVMAESLEEIEVLHGSIDAYLTGPALMAPETLDQLRKLLVE